jgi:anti-sigma-K factor RskA
MRLLTLKNLHELTGVFALDAIDGLERDRFEHHLTRCASCAHEVRGLQETATRFALAVTARPPAELKERVLGLADRTRQLPPAQHRHVRPTEPWALWLRRLAIPLAAACLVVAVVLGVLLGMARSQLDSARTEQRQVAAILNAPGARIVSARTALGGSATVVVASRLHELVFTSRGMPRQPSSKVYQLWLLRSNGSATSAGLLSIAPGGSTVPVLASGLEPGDRVGVTVEPAGGTARPTTTPIVVLSVAP